MDNTIKKQNINEPYFTNKENDQITQKYISKFDLSNEKKIKSNNKNKKKLNLSLSHEYNDDFLLSLRRRYDDIFKQIKGHEKIFDELKQNYKKKKVSNEIIKGAVFLRKLNFHENFPKKKKTPKLDVNKVIEIQKIFKGHFIRDINFKIDRLKLRQCLIELFCLLIYGNWYRAKIRYYFLILIQCYNDVKLDVGKELTFEDKISFKLPNKFYSGTKINNLSSIKIGKDFMD